MKTTPNQFATKNIHAAAIATVAKFSGLTLGNVVVEFEKRLHQ